MNSELVGRDGSSSGSTCDGGRGWLPIGGERVMEQGGSMLKEIWRQAEAVHEKAT